MGDASEPLQILTRRFLFFLSHYVCLSQSCSVFSHWWSLLSRDLGLAFSDLEPDDPATLEDVKDENWYSREMRKMQMILPPLILFQFGSINIS